MCSSSACIVSVLGRAGGLGAINVRNPMDNGWTTLKVPTGWGLAGRKAGGLDLLEAGEPPALPGRLALPEDPPGAPW